MTFSIMQKELHIADWLKSKGDYGNIVKWDILSLVD